uniref:Uncharacterized protein n=1 Tax=viral metagenome TaxID=1070528 RepID=A0A6H1Z9F6_9ZZZZ
MVNTKGVTADKLHMVYLVGIIRGESLVGITKLNILLGELPTGSSRNFSLAVAYCSAVPARVVTARVALESDTATLNGYGSA